MHYPDSEPTGLFSPSCCVLSGKATNTNFIVFGFTWSGLKPTIYHTRGEHANHYTTDAVINNEWAIVVLMLNEQFNKIMIDFYSARLLRQQSKISLHIYQITKTTVCRKRYMSLHPNTLSDSKPNSQKAHLIVMIIA